MKSSYVRIVASNFRFANYFQQWEKVSFEIFLEMHDVRSIFICRKLKFPERLMVQSYKIISIKRSRNPSETIVVNTPLGSMTYDFCFLF